MIERILFRWLPMLLLTGMFIFISSCNKDDEEAIPIVPGSTVIYTDETKDGFYDGTFYYRIGDINNYTLIVSGPSKTLYGNVTIPQYVTLASKNLLKKFRTTYTVTYIGDWSLIDSNISSITFPETLTKIGRDAFYSCKHLKSLKLPSSMKEIGETAFLSCENLNSLTLPSSMKEIGKHAFLGCNNLRDVYCYAETPPNNNDAFSYYTERYGTLHVPSSSLSKYKADSQWSNFYRIVGDL